MGQKEGHKTRLAGGKTAEKIQKLGSNLAMQMNGVMPKIGTRNSFP